MKTAIVITVFLLVQAGSQIHARFLIQAGGSSSIVQIYARSPTQVGVHKRGMPL